MATLYLLEQNTILRKTSDRLRLCRMRTPGERRSHVTQGEVLLELPCADIDQVMLFGNVQVTTQALQELLQHGIEISLFTRSGKLLGQLTPPKTKNILLRIDQFKRHQDQNFRLNLARHIVVTKISNMMTILKMHQANYPGTFSADQLNQLENLSNQTTAIDKNSSLLGIEGTATAHYFRLFGRMFKPPWKFEGRTRRPPKDPVNAVLSFGYVLVGAELHSLLDGIGFDPYLGFYHTVKYGRPSLALDLLEEFRHSLVDRLTLNLFNLGILKTEDFDSLPRGDGVYLGTTGKKKFFIQYEKMLGQYQSDTDPADKKPGFRAIFQKRIYELAKLIRLDSSQSPVIDRSEEDYDS
ncbi:MAG: CRISPR-associated endonuclease Cas1 [bacterium]|nr:CRISPR-associated endonuclease Cas1 [bacterium]